MPSTTVLQCRLTGDGVMTESGSRWLRGRLGRMCSVLVVVGVGVWATSDALSAAGASPSNSPAGNAVAAPELSAAVARTTAAIALEKRALALLDAYDPITRTAAPRPIARSPSAVSSGGCG